MYTDRPDLCAAEIVMFFTEAPPPLPPPPGPTTREGAHDSSLDAAARAHAEPITS